MGDDKKKKKTIDITKKVTDAITDGDFSKLNDIVKDSVKDAVEDVVDEIKRISNRPRTKYSSSGGHTRHGVFSPNDRFTGYKDGYAGDNHVGNNGSIMDGINSRPYNNYGNPNQHYNVANPMPSLPRVRYIPKNFGSAMAIRAASWFFGVIFLLSFLGSLGYYGEPSTLITVGLLTVLCGFGIVHSNKKLGNLKKAKRLYFFIKERSYIPISEIAEIFHCDVVTARKKMYDILEQGIFPEARMDSSGTTLLLTRESYDNYKYIEKRRQTLQLEEDMERQQIEDSDAAKELTPEQRQDWLNVVKDGEGYIQKLRILNDEIPEEVISTRLDELESLLKQIFDRVKKKPSEANQMRKFMDYYLPTTVKLVEKFKEFSNLSIPGKEILDAKSNIENTIGTINQAFVEMLNNLYKNDVYDVTTDASVIKTMLAKEGLTSDFK